MVVEFDRYIAAGDLEKTRRRLEEIESKSDNQDGFMGMYL
jgi:heme-degrading monooxygenase HmoA